MALSCFAGRRKRQAFFFLPPHHSTNPPQLTIRQLSHIKVTACVRRQPEFYWLFQIISRILHLLRAVGNFWNLKKYVVWDQSTLFVTLTFLDPSPAPHLPRENVTGGISVTNTWKTADSLTILDTPRHSWISFIFPSLLILEIEAYLAYYFLPNTTAGFSLALALALLQDLESSFYILNWGLSLIHNLGLLSEAALKV